MRRTRTRRRSAPLLPGRRTDRLEDLVAWALMSLGLFAVLGSVLLGHAAYDAALGRGAPPSPVQAVLLADAPRAPAADQRVPALQQLARVTWTAADGVVHVVEVRVPPAQRAGSAVTVWLDRAGRVVVDPSATAPLEACLEGAPGRVVLAIGPEGGFTGRELGHLQDRGFALGSLGSRVLRSDVATVAALARAHACLAARTG